MTRSDITSHNVIDDLDSFYCHNIVASLWADAVANRLEGMAIYLLSDELPEVAEHGAQRPAAWPTGSAISAAPSPLTPGSSSTAHRPVPSSPFPTARTRGPSSATRWTAWTSSSRPTRPSWTQCGDRMM